MLAPYSPSSLVLESALSRPVAWTRAVLAVLIVAFAATTTRAQMTVGTELTR